MLSTYQEEFEPGSKEHGQLRCTVDQTCNESLLLLLQLHLSQRRPFPLTTHVATRDST